MKKIIILLSVFMLAGCTTLQPASLKENLIAKINLIKDVKIEDKADNNKILYRYYTEPSVGRRYSSQTGNIFVYNNQEFIMNLDIAHVIGSRYYNITSSSDQNTNALITLNGTYIDFNEQKLKYDLQIYDMGSNEVYITVKLGSVNFFAYTEYANVTDLVVMMFKIAKTVEINEEKVISIYSSKPSTEYVREQVDLFEVNFQESGRIEELAGISIDSEIEEFDSITEEDMGGVHDVYGDESND